VGFAIRSWTFGNLCEITFSLLYLEICRSYLSRGASNSNSVGIKKRVRLGLLTNLTNVKAAVFAVAFIPQFVPKHFSLGWGIFLLAIVQALVSTTWYGSLISVVDRASVFLARPKIRRALTGISAVGILVLAIGLLLTSPR
jgi:threonine/homoserine/homoserine lactone efflux protein